MQFPGFTECVGLGVFEFLSGNAAARLCVCFFVSHQLEQRGWMQGKRRGEEVASDALLLFIAPLCCTAHANERRQMLPVTTALGMFILSAVRQRQSVYSEIMCGKKIEREPPDG